jgi:arylsulfatase A-like enzyme
MNQAMKSPNRACTALTQLGLTHSLVIRAYSFVILLLAFSSLAASPPNIVFILTDNHGAWTLGCYGNKDIHTPNIDRLASEGTLFTRAYANNAVCSPTRASYLTGLMLSQHGVHRYLGGAGHQTGPNPQYTLAEFRTLPKILSEAGYTCGLSGKWHLGDNLKPQDGFSFWVTMPAGHTTTFYNAEVIENGVIRKEPTYLTDYWTKRGIEFIEKSKDKPFFLYLAYNGPYGLGGSMLEPARNRHAAEYAGKELKSYPREPMNPWMSGTKNLYDKNVPRERYSAEVSGVDDGVGEILATLKRLKLDQNTLVIFAGDQGLSGGHSGFWGMGDHTRPLTAYDPMLHIPFMFRLPGVVPAGQRNDHLVSNYDFLPTVLNLLGLKDKTPTAPPLPGHDLTPIMKDAKAPWDDTVYFEFENVRSIRTTKWKYIERIKESPNELYDLASDPGEKKNLVDKPELATTQKELRARLYKFFDRYADPKWDLWKGGKSKTHLATAALFGQEINPENPNAKKKAAAKAK